MIFQPRRETDRTVVATLASALRRDISFGVLRPDQKLKLAELRERYGGSNHSMRETLQMLAAEGLVEATSQRGFRVTSATQEDLHDILLMRLQVEKLGLSMSLERASVDWEGRVIAAMHALERAEADLAAGADDLTALQWDEASRALSAALVAQSGSRRLVGLQETFYNQSRRFRLALLREGRVDLSGRAARRGALRDAILARDTGRACAILDEDVRQDMAPASVS